ncbi:MAG: peptidase S9, prolyl oligopeptidase [Acidobacteria bacterium]|nr:MAG: peptidase S9, prolyl oligopeptidase [Acidobacteriota bacterium]
MLALLFAASVTVVAAQSDVLSPADNLVVEGIPKIPAAMAEEINRYTEFRYAGLSNWHPTKREMLISTRFADTSQIHLVKFPGGARTQLTFFKDSASGASYQPTRGDYFVFSKGSGGNENYQKYRYDFATGAITLLTDGKSRNTGGVWANAGDRYAYESTRRNGEDVDIWMLNPADPKSDRMVAQLKGGGWGVYEFSPDDKQMLIGESISANESYLWLMDVATGNKTLITPKGEPVKVLYGSAQFSKDGKGIYVTTDRDSEFQRLAYIDLATKKHTYLTPSIIWDVEFFTLSWDGKTIAFVTNENGLSVLYLFDTARRKEMPASKLSAGVISALEWHRNNRDLGFAMESARATYDTYSFDMKTGKTERWTESETGGINTQTFSLPEVVRWKTFDDKMISGLYYKPPSKFSGKRPVIIDIHGGPEGQSRPWFQAENNYFVNELGTAVIQPNVRGSTGYGKTFVTLDNGFLREGSYKDIASLLDWIKTRPDLDPDRIMVTGGSYGGHMTLAVATFYANGIRCALDVVGPSNLVTFLENTSAYRRDLRRVEYGDERDPKMREFLNRIAPLNNADKIIKPLFVVQGGNDPRVPLSESQQIVRTVRKNGTPVWYLMAKDEGHGFAKKQNRDFQLYATVLFMKEYLLK